MKLLNSRTASVAVGAVVVVAFGATTAGAASLVTSAQIKNNTIQSQDIRDGGVRLADLSSGAKTALHGAKGATGVKGAAGKDAMFGAIYRVENYQNGGTGSATVACADTDAASQKYTAIAGGVQGSESGKTETQSGFLVSSSFPGRMDWSTGEPKANRLDGWIVFGNGQNTSTLKVWALCVPTANIPVQTVNLDN